MMVLWEQGDLIVSYRSALVLCLLTSQVASIVMNLHFRHHVLFALVHVILISCTLPRFPPDVRFGAPYIVDLRYHDKLTKLK